MSTDEHASSGSQYTFIVALAIGLAVLWVFGQYMKQQGILEGGGGAAVTTASETSTPTAADSESNTVRTMNVRAGSAGVSPLWQQPSPYRTQVRIADLLAGRSSDDVVLENMTGSTISVDGWSARSNRSYTVSLPGHTLHTGTAAHFRLPAGFLGDTETLQILDEQGRVVDVVTLN